MEMNTQMEQATKVAEFIANDTDAEDIEITQLQTENEIGKEDAETVVLN